MHLDPLLARRLADIALCHVTQEWPTRLDHLLTGPADLLPPRQLHPVFFGSFDWHSSVHTHWLLARLLPHLPDRAAAIRARFDAAFSPDAVAGERAYLARPGTAGFERPYGWAWLLALHTALEALEEPRWAAALAPLARDFAVRFHAWLPRATYPLRPGMHSNSAFALTLSADWAARHDTALLELFRATAQRWYGGDTDCQAWEPSGEDFLSPALAEALCMARLLPGEDFAGWLDRFLPRLAQRDPASLFTPARVADRTDGRIVHLDGLNLSRAWCWRQLAQRLPTADPRHALLAATTQAHLAEALPHLDDHYMGAHWLASFALLALEGL